jgi:hypothetical protein
VVLAKEGKTHKHGLPTALHYPAFAQTFKNELVFIQNPLQWAVRLVVTALMGYKTFYKRQENSHKPYTELQPQKLAKEKTYDFRT